MISRETLRDVVKSQRGDLASMAYGVERESLKRIDLSLPFALVLTGVRRCGKSTLLRQLMRKNKAFYYFNFEDPRVLGLEVGDFQKLDDVFREEYGKSGRYFLDEVQNVRGWEVFVRSRMDKGKKFVITGSNASFLSRELGTKLTGRHVRHELFPFSYREMLKLTGKKQGVASFDEYLVKGGFPDYLKHGTADFLRELFSNVITRDIIVRHKLRNAKTVKELALLLLTDAGKEFSYNRLAKTLGLGSINTAISFVSFLEDSYLLFTVPKFDYSLRKQLAYQKKIYSIDNGLSGANSASFSADKGRMLENAIFLQLRRKHEGIFYFKGRGECDFVVKEKGKVTKAIQACYELHEDNKRRELDGLVEALEELRLPFGLILTHDQEDNFTIDGKSILVMPAWKWMLKD